MDPRELWRADSALVVHLRTERGWGRAKLAAAAGVSKHTVAKIERGEAVFPATLSFVAHALGVPGDALRASSEAPPPIPASRRRLLESLQGFYDAYNIATRNNDVAMLYGEFKKKLTGTIHWSAATTHENPLNGIYNGRESVKHFLHTSLAIVKRYDDMRPEQTELLSGRRVLTRYVDRVGVEDFGIVTAATMHLFEFDRRGRVIQFHQSSEFVSIEPYAL